jgi:hypothetical protein
VPSLSFIRPAALRVSAAAVVVAAVLGACKPKVVSDATSGDQATRPWRALVLLPPVSNATLGAALATMGSVVPDSPMVGSDQVLSAVERCMAEARVLVIPEARSLPIASWPVIEKHINQGGPVLFWGRDPLGDRVAAGPRGPEAQSAVDARLVAESEAAHALPPLAEWKQSAGAGSSLLSLPVAPTDMPWGGATCEVRDFRDWAALVLHPLPPDAVAYDRNALALQARGGPDTSKVVIECDETDGSHWYAAMDVSGAWQSYLLRQEMFRYAYGGLGRGATGDHLRLARLAKISVGLSMAYAPQAPGNHRFSVSELRLVADARPAAQILDWPDLPMITPPYRRYATQIDVLDIVGPTNRVLPVRGLAVQCPLRRPLGTGGAQGLAARWIPLAYGLGPMRQNHGAPVSAWIEARADGAIRKVAWIGMDPSAERATMDAAVLRAAFRKLAAEAHLMRAGTDRFSYNAGETIDATASWIRGATTNAGLRVQFQLVDPRGTELRHVLSPPLSPDAPDGGPIAATLGPAPKSEAETRSFTLRVSLLDRQGATVHDTIEQPMRILPVLDLAREERIMAGGPQLTVQGRPVTLLGVNYWPLYAVGKGPGDDRGHWLMPGVFDPEQVARDLDRLREAGVNALSVQYLDPAEAPQLRYLAEEARLRRMWLDVYVAHLQPLDQDLEKAEALIRAADFPSMPRVFALDIAWEPHFGTQASRRRFDPDWRAWLQDQYGNIAHAEFMLRYPLWREEGQVTSPPDEHLSSDGPHRGAVAAYRRFMDDYTSRRYGEVVRFLRRFGVTQLLSARTGYGGTGSAWSAPYAPVDPAAGAVHLDFISPEGWGLVTDDDFAGAGFITAYCRGASGGKPVVWKEFGLSVGSTPDAVEFRNQERLYRSMFDLVLRSRSSGCFAWWYPGGWRVDERSDMGVVNPDGTWRKVRDAFTEFTFKLRQAARTPPPWRGREVSRDVDARGLHGLWMAWKDQYRDEVRQDRMEEVRLKGHARETQHLEVRSLSGAFFNEPAPMEQVNAEWGYVRLGSKELDRRFGETIPVRAQQNIRMELINTGAATWSASAPRRPRTAWVRATSDQGIVTTITVPEVAPGGRTMIDFVFREPGQWTVRPWLADTGEFGEQLRFTVQPSADR